MASISAKMGFMSVMERDRKGSPTIMDSGVKRGMGRAAHLGRRAGPLPWAVIALAAALLAPAPAQAAAPLEARLASLENGFGRRLSQRLARNA